MKTNLRYLLVMALAAAFMPDAAALDLPVKDINGKSYYYYAVRRGDTLLSIATRLGITRDDLVRYNRSAADGLRQGTTLYLPVDEFKDVVSPGESAAAEMASAGADGRYPTNVVYRVRRGETLFGVSHLFGISPDAIIALNPTADRGIKAGQQLIIPAGAHINQAVTVEPYGETPQLAMATAAPVEAPAVEAAPAVEPEPVAVPPMPADSEMERSLRPVPGPVPVTEPETATDTLRPSIAVMLPLSLGADASTKQARSATEFVRGFMLGLKILGGNAWPMDIHIYDTAGRTDTVATLLSTPEAANLDLIITPDAQPMVSATIAALGNRDTYLLNLMAVQDTAYLKDYRVMQFNVPHDIMYSKAAEALLMAYDGYTPVMLISKGGRSEKLPFTDYLRSVYAEAGITPLEIAFEGMLTALDLEVLDPETPYVFIPGSGSLTEFNKFARTLINLRESGAGDRIAVFGYPDWTAFRGDALESLHSLGAMIYSRFYADESASDVRRFKSDYEARYGTAPAELVPSQAMLGYDTARYLIEIFAATKGEFDPEWDAPMRGLQSTFKFTDAESPLDIDGVANVAVYIITFLDGDEVSVQVL